MGKFKSKLENYWYHYKWHTLIVLFFAVFISIMVGQMCTKESSDVYIIYAGPVSLSAEKKTELSDCFSQVMAEDYNGDGKKNVEILDILLMTDGELQDAYDRGMSELYLSSSTIQSNHETLNMYAMAGDFVIYLIDADWYGGLHNVEAFITLEELAERGISFGEGAKRYDDCSYYFKSLDFARFFNAFDLLPDDTLLCVRRAATTSVIKGEEKARDKYDQQLAYFKSLVSFKLPEGFVDDE